MLHNNLKAVLFDFDGTLLNSSAVHYAAYVAMFARFDIEMTEDKFWELYSPNWLAVYAAAGLAEEDWELADKIWLSEVAKQDPILFPGVQDLLTHLQGRFLLGMVTSGSKERVLRDLKSTGLAEFFPILVTGDDITKRKPDPEGLIIALNALEIVPQQAIYVGDTHEDRLMALSAGVPFVGVENRVLRPVPQEPFPMIQTIGDLTNIIGLEE